MAELQAQNLDINDWAVFFVKFLSDMDQELKTKSSYKMSYVF